MIETMSFAPPRMPTTTLERGARTERALALKASAGDPRALAGIYTRYRDGMYRVALRLTGSVEDAEDIVHDVFASLPRTLATFAGRGTLGGWLRTAAKWRALMLLRRERSRREFPLDLALAPPARAPESVAERIDLERALETLPPGARSVFLLWHVEGYTHEEIGEVLGISAGGSKSQLHHARRRLKARLQ